MSYLENLILFTLFIFLAFAVIIGCGSSVFISSLIGFEPKGKASKRKTVFIYAASHLAPLLIFLRSFFWLSNGQFNNDDKESILSNLDIYLDIIKWGTSSSFIIAIGVCLLYMFKGIYHISCQCREE